MASIFTKIVNGEVPAHKVAENDKFLAFLDVFPLKEGHVLVIPKEEVDYMFNLDEETYQDLWLFARQIAVALKKAIPCKRIGIAVIGIEVPHVHIHLVPMNTVGDLNFTAPKQHFSSEQMAETAAKIRSNF